MVAGSVDAGSRRRLKVFCVTCSFAPDDLFFPIIVTASIKGTWFLFSFAVCLNLFSRPGCTDGISAPLTVSAIGFTCLQFLVFIHKIVLLLASTRGTIRDPSHKFVRELLLTGVVIYTVEVVWAVYSVVAVLTSVTDDGSTLCESLHRPITAYVVLVWLNWFELAVLALVYFSCLDRCKCFCCRAICSLRCGKNVNSSPDDVDSQWNVEANIRVVPTSRDISASHLCSVTREKLCTCRRDGLNNSKNVALLDLSHALEVLFRDMEVHYTALDRLSGWILVQKYHSQLLRRGDNSLATEELLRATLRFLTKKGVIDRYHEIRQPQPLEEADKLPETLLYYFWFAMAAYGWSVKVFLEPLSGTCTLCRGARCCCCVGEEGEEGGTEERWGVGLLKSSEVASIAGINAEDIILGKSTNDIHCPPFFVCRTTRHDKVTGEMKKEVVITIRGTLSVKDVMTNVTASMRDATKCQESLVEKWFLLLVKTKLTFLGVQDAYFHTGFYKSAKVILNTLRKSKLFKDLVEKEHYRVVVAGHSLGAGVGAVLTLLIKQKHPHWADGLHAYLFSIPGAVCSYRLAERAEELGIITSVVGGYDLVPRISWRALTYLKLLVKKALEETDLKKQEILCCGNVPYWDPPIFGGSVYPVGLIDERSGAATPDFFELQESLPVVRRSTWDQVSEKRKKREAVRGCREEVRDEDLEGELVEDEDVEFQERRRSKITTGGEENVLEPLGLPFLEVHSEEDEQRKNDADRAEKVATEFLQEDTRLGPLMFIPGRILHIEEGEGVGPSARWCGVSLFGLRCCGIRCIRDRQVSASWKAREDMTGIILHRDCIVDHSPRRLFSMLNNLVNQVEPLPITAGDNETSLLSIEQSQTSVPHPPAGAEQSAPVCSSHGKALCDELNGHGTVMVEVYDHSERQL